MRFRIPRLMLNGKAAPRMRAKQTASKMVVIKHQREVLALPNLQATSPYQRASEPHAYMTTGEHKTKIYYGGGSESSRYAINLASYPISIGATEDSPILYEDIIEENTCKPVLGLDRKIDNAIETAIHIVNKGVSTHNYLVRYHSGSKAARRVQLWIRSKTNEFYL